MAIDLSGMFKNLGAATSALGESVRGPALPEDPNQRNAMQRAGVTNPMLQMFGTGLGGAMGMDMRSTSAIASDAYKGANLADPRSLMELAQRLEATRPEDAAKLRAKAVELVQKAKTEADAAAAAKREEERENEKLAIQRMEAEAKGIVYETSYDKQGNEVKVLINKNTGEVKPVGGSKFQGQIVTLVDENLDKVDYLVNTVTGERVKKIGTSDQYKPQIDIKEEGGTYSVFKDGTLVNQYGSKSEAEAAATQESAILKAGNAIALIDDQLNALEKDGVGGWASAAFEWLPSSDERDFKANMETLRAIIGFKELRDLKNEGGTLGQVSNIENQLLQAVLGNLDTWQDPAQIAKNLRIIRQSFQNIVAAKNGSLSIEQFEDGSKAYRRGDGSIVRINADGTTKVIKG